MVSCGFARRTILMSHHEKEGGQEYAYTQTLHSRKELTFQIGTNWLFLT